MRIKLRCARVPSDVVDVFTAGNRRDVWISAYNEGDSGGPAVVVLTPAKVRRLRDALTRHLAGAKNGGAR